MNWFAWKSAAILALGLTLGSSLGCARKPSLPSTTNPVATPSMQTVESVDFDQRTPVALAGLDEPIWGSPVGAQPVSSVRSLSLEACQNLARAAAPLAIQIDRHRTALECQLGQDHPLVTALALQAEHERQTHAALALESYLGLAEIYSQQPLIQESHSILQEAQRALKKFREQEVALSGDPSELDRQSLRVDQKEAELVGNQERLQAVLAWALNLQTDHPHPLWTALNTSPLRDIPSIEDATASAWAKRSDLRALETLACSPCDLPSESLSGPLGTAHPGLATTLPLPGPAQWWQCGLEKELAGLKAKTAAEQRQLLAGLAAEKRRAIELELRQILAELQQHQSVSALKYEELSSLMITLDTARKMKDEKPVDFSLHLEQRLRLLTLTSEFLHERFALESAFVRLAKALGNLE